MRTEIEAGDKVELRVTGRSDFVSTIVIAGHVGPGGDTIVVLPADTGFVDEPVEIEAGPILGGDAVERDDGVYRAVGL